MKKAPKCCLCGKSAQNQKRDGRGKIVYRKITYDLAAELGIPRDYMCAKCHTAYVAKKRGCKSITEVLAKNAGFDDTNRYLNSKHPYRKFRKDYCENDGSLGIAPCTCKIVGAHQLDTHHKDGNNKNNDPANLITLCKNCHADLHFHFKDLKGNANAVETNSLSSFL